MKKQVKSFGEFTRRKVNEDLGMEDSGNGGIAKLELYSSAFGTFSVVSFKGEEIELEDREEDYGDDGNYTGWKRIFAAARQLGASGNKIFSVEDNKIIHIRDVMDHDWSDYPYN
jgi:hypothetical protein